VPAARFLVGLSGGLMSSRPLEPRGETSNTGGEKLEHKIAKGAKIGENPKGGGGRQPIGLGMLAVALEPSTPLLNRRA
jgi:hypothetical protein